MIPHMDSDLALLVVVTEVPRLGGLLVKYDRFVWNGYYWEERPLPWWRRWAVSWLAA